MKLLLLCGVLAGLVGGLIYANLPSAPLPVDSEADLILIVKHSRTLALIRAGVIVKQYSISLGRSPIRAKQKEGDHKTPEGLYQVVEHKRNSQFHRALRIYYPEERDIALAQAGGYSPGSDIMIHGIRNGLGLVGRFHQLVDWTAGCIALTDPEIDEVFAACPDGTPIEIRP